MDITLALLVLGALLGGFVSGLAGFGGGPVVLVLWLIGGIAGVPLGAMLLGMLSLGMVRAVAGIFLVIYTLVRLMFVKELTISVASRWPGPHPGRFEPRLRAGFPRAMRHTHIRAAMHQT